MSRWTTIDKLRRLAADPAASAQEVETAHRKIAELSTQSAGDMPPRPPHLRNGTAFADEGDGAVFVPRWAWSYTGNTTTTANVAVHEWNVFIRGQKP